MDKADVLRDGAVELEMDVDTIAEIEMALLNEDSIEAEKIFNAAMVKMKVPEEVAKKYRLQLAATIFLPRKTVVE